MGRKADGEEGGWGGKKEEGKKEEAEEAVGGAPGWPVSGSYFACVCWSPTPCFLLPSLSSACLLPTSPSPFPSAPGVHVLSSSEVQLALGEGVTSSARGGARSSDPVYYPVSTPTPED